MACPETCKRSCQKRWQYIVILVGFILVVLQSISLSCHLEKYSCIDGIGHVGWLGVSVLVSWACILKFCKTPLSYLWIVQACYAVQLAVFFVFIFGTPEIRDKLSRNEDELWLPNCRVKISIYLTPAIALLHINSASDARKYGDLVFIELCYSIAIDRCDDIAALSILIELEPKGSPSIKDDGCMVVSIITIVVLSLLLSTLDLADKKFGNGAFENQSKKREDDDGNGGLEDQSKKREDDDGNGDLEDQSKKRNDDDGNGDLENQSKKRNDDDGNGNLENQYKKRAFAYLVTLAVKIVLAIALLVIRLIAWLKYKHDASVFIAKSVIFIVIYFYQGLRQIHQIYRTNKQKATPVKSRSSEEPLIDS